jgi:hypothetical protein
MITQNWRMLWTEWAMNEGVFVESMMRIIEAGQVLAAKFRKLHGVGLDARVEMPHHEFFRIHDAGDFYDEAYLDAWLEICRKMPHVHFWAPTRVWADPEMAAVLERRVARNKIPRNLVIRPSGLFFDGSCPIIKGLAGGSTSSKITVESVGDRIRVDIEAAPRDAWGCPAYLPDVIGGGAFPAIKPKPEEGAEVQENPAVAQTFAMYPPVDEASVASADGVFYDALMDPKTGRYIIETGKGRIKHGFGRPMRATKTNQNKHKGSVVVKAQKYQAAGACPVARDPHRDAECRVCWGVSKGQRDQSQAKQPIVYAKH